MLLSLSCEDNRVERRDVKSERMQFRSCERHGRQGEALAEGTCGHRSISGSELKLSASQGHEIPGGSLLHLGIILKFASTFNMNFQSQPLLFFFVQLINSNIRLAVTSHPLTSNVSLVRH